MNKKEIAVTTLNQLCQAKNGVGRLKAMTGACNFAVNEDGAVSFKFKGSKIANHMRIKLNSLDLYDMTFIKIWGTKYTEVKKFDGVYNDMLKDLFEQTTGLYLSFN